MSDKHDEIARELLPCPFCGGTAELDPADDSERTWFVGCATCGCATDTSADKLTPVQEWNRRDASALRQVERETLNRAERAIRELRESHQRDTGECDTRIDCDYVAAWETAEGAIRSLSTNELSTTQELADLSTPVKLIDRDQTKSRLEQLLAQLHNAAAECVKHKNAWLWQLVDGLIPEIRDLVAKVDKLRRDQFPGWTLVPVKHDGKAGPTNEMARAFWQAFQEANTKHGFYESFYAGYNAMIEVAPKHPVIDRDQSDGMRHLSEVEQKVMDRALMASVKIVDDGYVRVPMSLLDACKTKLQAYRANCECDPHCGITRKELIDWIERVAQAAEKGE